MKAYATGPTNIEIQDFFIFLNFKKYFLNFFQNKFGLDMFRSKDFLDY